MFGVRFANYQGFVCLFIYLFVIVLLFRLFYFIYNKADIDSGRNQHAHLILYFVFVSLFSMVGLLLNPPVGFRRLFEGQKKKKKKINLISSYIIESCGVDE